MAKVTTKLQVTIPKAIATRYGIAPGDEVNWIAAGDAIRVELGEKPSLRRGALEDRLDSFDQATERQTARQTGELPIDAVTETGRGWTREELYDRGGTG